MRLSVYSLIHSMKMNQKGCQAQFKPRLEMRFNQHTIPTSYLYMSRIVYFASLVTADGTIRVGLNFA